MFLNEVVPIHWQTELKAMLMSTRQKHLDKKKKKPEANRPGFRKPKLAFLSEHNMLHLDYVLNAWEGCANVPSKQMHSLHNRATILLLLPPGMDYKQKCYALKLLPLDKQPLFKKCVVVQNPTLPERYKS